VDEVSRLYQLDEPLEKAQTPWIIDTIERLANEPWFGRFLLFIAFFSLMTEASAPGLGVPGFISALCFLLFFWIQFFNGTAGWLEIALFVGGLVFIGIEIFVLPGIGIFGIGGGLMVLFSIILASQTFVVPRNGYQLGQTANSMLSIALIGLGLIVSAVVMRRYLPKTNFFHRLAVEPPSGEERVAMDWKEAVVHLDHLVGMVGVTTTPLSPSGKVRLDDKVVDVISDGEMVAADVEVVVDKVAGNRVVVRRKSETE
jgi:membrane-bound ClpP family serine protease